MINVFGVSLFFSSNCFSDVL